MTKNKELIYKSDARRAVLKDNPASAYCIDNIKPVDAVEVVHGQWVRKPIGNYPGADEVCCSVCGTFIAVVGSDTGFEEAKRDMYYCNYCGAKMDLEG